MITPEQIAEEAEKVTDAQIYDFGGNAALWTDKEFNRKCIAYGRLLEREEQAERSAELERDAARWKWVRAHTFRVVVAAGMLAIEMTRRAVNDAANSSEADAAIDAELAKGV